MEDQDNWRLLLNMKYAEPEYQAFMSSTSVSTKNTSRRPTRPLPSQGSQSKISKENVLHSLPMQEKDLYNIFEAIRFPPVPVPLLPESIDIIPFSYGDESDHPAVTEILPLVLTREDNDILAAVRFMFGLLSTLAGRSSEIREAILENGRYLISLGEARISSASPGKLLKLARDDAEYISTTVIDNLHAIKDELLGIQVEMDVFHPTKLADLLLPDEASSGYEDSYTIESKRTLNSSSHSNFNTARDSLLQLAQKLLGEITISLATVDVLKDYSNSLTHFPSFPICQIDSIRASFANFEPGLKPPHLRMSQRCAEFVVFMSVRKFLATDSMYRYLQDPEGYGNSLIFTDCSFQKGEFKACLDYLNFEDEVSLGVDPANGRVGVIRRIREISVISCGLTDQDLHYLTILMSKMEKLAILRLSYNSLSYSSIASLATAVFQNHSNIEILYLDHNKISGDGVKLLGDCIDKFPRLEVLSLSFNPIGDRGLYSLLKRVMNRHRKQFLNIPKFSGAGGESDDEGSLGDESRSSQDGDSSNSNNSDESSLAHDSIHNIVGVDDPLLEALHSQKRYPINCYFPDYFAPQMLKVLYMAKTRDAVDYSWVNGREEEFMMDEDNYSVASGSAEVDAADGTSTLPSNKHEEASRANSKMSFREMLESRVSRIRVPEDEVTQEELIRTYPKLVQLMLRVRVRVAAVAMFMTLQRRGHPCLSAIHVAGCGLTSGILPMIGHCLADNHFITDIDLSHNEELLMQKPSCVSMAHIVERSALRSLGLSNSGVTDSGLMYLTRPFAATKHLKHVELSHNNIGPTGANIVANLCKEFFCDKLVIRGGRERSAPVLRPGMHSDDGDGDISVDPELVDPRKKVLEKTQKTKRNDSGVNHQKNRLSIKRDDGSVGSFKDLDTYDEEDEGEEVEDEDDNEIDGSIYDNEYSDGGDELPISPISEGTSRLQIL